GVAQDAQAAQLRQPAERRGLNPRACGFDSHAGHRRTYSGSVGNGRPAKLRPSHAVGSNPTWATSGSLQLNCLVMPGGVVGRNCNSALQPHPPDQAIQLQPTTKTTLPSWSS